MIEIEATLEWVRSEGGKNRDSNYGLFFFFQKFDYNEEKRDSALAAGELC